MQFFAIFRFNLYRIGIIILNQLGIIFVFEIFKEMKEWHFEKNGENERNHIGENDYNQPEWDDKQDWVGN